MTSRGASIALALFVATCAVSSSAYAQTTPSCDDLDKLRSLFNDAYKDEQEKHFEPALEKFRAVEKCRASPSVRYRIASVLDSLGRLREARDAFRSLAAEKPSLAPKEAAI